MPHPDPIPGSYAVTIKGKLADGTQFARLAMYSFQQGGTMREDFWYWQHSSVYKFDSTDRMVGSVSVPGYASQCDQDKFVQGVANGPGGQACRFFGGEADCFTLYGTWQLMGNDISLTWSDGSTETWRLTWTDSTASPQLYKIELTGASDLTSRCFLAPNNTTTPRSTDVVNAGWGFGAPGTGFLQGRTVAECRKNYRGMFLRHNVWYRPARDEDLSEDQMNLANFVLTDKDVLRYVSFDCETAKKEGDGRWVFSYFSRPTDNPKMLARRVMYQTSHDFDNTGHIEDDKGHTYYGLQIQDTGNRVRGFVFADASDGGLAARHGEHTTISALYYLDDWSDAAHYGLEPG